MPIFKAFVTEYQKTGPDTAIPLPPTDILEYTLKTLRKKRDLNSVEFNSKGFHALRINCSLVFVTSDLQVTDPINTLVLF